MWRDEFASKAIPLVVTHWREDTRSVLNRPCLVHRLNASEPRKARIEFSIEEISAGKTKNHFVIMSNMLAFLILCVVVPVCSIPFWRIETSPPAYLLGTIHIPSGLVWPYVPEEIRQAFLASTDVFTEVDSQSDSYWEEFLVCVTKRYGRTTRSRNREDEHLLGDGSFVLFSPFQIDSGYSGRISRLGSASIEQNCRWSWTRGIQLSSSDRFVSSRRSSKALFRS